MFFDYIDIPDELIEAQEEGNLVVFAGAGVSMGKPSNLPSFRELAEKIAGSHPLSKEIKKYESRLDVFLGELSRDGVNVQGECRRIIGEKRSKPTELHSSILDLFAKPENVRIVTTNFDNHFSTTIKERCWEVDHYFAPALPLGHQFTGLVYIHGWIKREKEPLILTDEDFGRAYLTEGWAREFLKQLFSKFTTLFIGYSHNDLPLIYLARGMSGKQLAPRFAFASLEEDIGFWKSLGVQVIPFNVGSGDNKFEKLYVSIKKWAEFSKQQPTDIAEQVKNIVCMPENIIPDKSQSSLLKHCIERDDKYHFFTNAARGWRWVEWLQEQSLLEPLFKPNSSSQIRLRGLADWLAKELLAEESDKGLLLIEQHNNCMGSQLWYALFNELSTNEKLDWNHSIIQKWALLVIMNCESKYVGNLDIFLNKICKSFSHSLCMALMRRLTEINIVVNKELVFESDKQTRDKNKAELKYKAKLDFEVGGKNHKPLDINIIWNSIKPHLPELKDSFLLLLENRLREAFDLYSIAARSDQTFDPPCLRVKIYQSNPYLNNFSSKLILKLLMLLIEERENKGWSLPETLITNWLTSGIPVLVWVGLYALYLSKNVTKPRKVELIKKYELIYPAIFEATHEAWLVLTDCYNDLNIEEKESLWRAIDEGPKDGYCKEMPQDHFNELRQNQINKLTWFLATKNPNCPLAFNALKKLKERQPDFQSYDGINQVFCYDGKALEGLKSPKQVFELLSSSPHELIDWLLEYKGGDDLTEESRGGLLKAVSEACIQNPKWGIELLEELVQRNIYNSDLIQVVLWRLKFSDLPEEKQRWLLESVKNHIYDFIKNFNNLKAITFFLFETVGLEDQKCPSSAILEQMIQLSLLIWRQLRSVDRSVEAHVNTKFKNKEWFKDAINHPAGDITRFWLGYTKMYVNKSDKKIIGFPDRLKDPLEDIVAGMYEENLLGRAVLAQAFSFVYHIDPVWAKAKLLPKFKFSNVGEEAFLMWEPFLCFGQLSRDSILLMRPIYKEAFKNIKDFKDDIKEGLYRHVAVIVSSCLFNVNEDDWFSDFLLALNDKEKAKWVQQFTYVLGTMPEERKENLWKQWMKDYWDGRLNGKPCKLLSIEAEEMIYWIFEVGSYFPDSVEFVIKGPPIGENAVYVALRMLKNNETAEKYPKSVVKLINWLLKNCKNKNCIDFNDMKLIISKLPKKKEFLNPLNDLCQQLTSLGYVEAVDLKHQNEKEFIED